MQPRAVRVPSASSVNARSRAPLWWGVVLAGAVLSSASASVGADPAKPVPAKPIVQPAPGPTAASEPIDLNRCVIQPVL